MLVQSHKYLYYTEEEAEPLMTADIFIYSFKYNILFALLQHSNFLF